MSPVIHAALASWSVPWLPTLVILITALTYLRGWYLLRCAGFPLLPAWRLWTFLAGLFSLWIALAGPMDVFNAWLLTGHMVQHMMLMMIAPPLILLGNPLLPLLRGMPILAAREFAGPFLNWRPAQRLGHLLTHPVFALVLMGVVMLGWHIPAAYELAVRSSGWHQFEHACFLTASLIFWWPVIEPWPSHCRWPRWAMVPYLVVADLQNTVLSATLVFADHVLYPSYTEAPRVFGLSPRQDQAAAGAIMWVIGSLAFLIPAMLIAVQCLTRRSQLAQLARLEKRSPVLAGSWHRVATRLGISSRRADALSLLTLFIATSLAFSAVLAFCGPDDDELVLRAQQRTGDLELLVYTSEEHLLVRKNDISVLVQDASGRPVLDADVEVSAGPAVAASSPGNLRAKERDGDNKLLKSATLDVPNAGDWLVQVVAKHEVQSVSLRFPSEAVVHTHGLVDWWPYFILPAVGLLLLVIYSRRANRRDAIARDHPMEAAASR